MNKRILILSGPTHEYIDPVRYIGNASSGLMGKAIAEAAAERGFAVDFVTGPVAGTSLPDPDSTDHTCEVISAADMLETARPLFDAADVIIFAAAVADYAPVERAGEKMPKKDAVSLQLKATPDIARTLCKQKREDQIAIGFALQTNDGEINARRKLEGKNLDGIVLNTPATLGALDGNFSFLSKGSEQFDVWGQIDKKKCAERIMNELAKLNDGK